MKTTACAFFAVCWFCLTAAAQGLPAAPELAAELQAAAASFGEPERAMLRTMLARQLREQITAANQKSSARWQSTRTRSDWEDFRREKLAALQESLGGLPQTSGPPRQSITGRLAGDGFEIRNLVYSSRAGLTVTANLYVPHPLRASMPGLLISHSHHNPKEQGELQDMGMTWARAGCYVLVPDHLGHGERRQHPFASAAAYERPFQVGRQDYYFRYDTSLQLYLAGETLMGWLVHDLRTGVDVLLAQPGIDKNRIALLGSVAGGGDPAAVAAALDQRIAVACPFNFGGPQPETPYPLPADAETSFNYAGGGSWESTRNLFRSAKEGFLPWVIVGSIAPRHLIHAHEFAWDRERDPVWRRYQAIWSLYGATDRLSFTHGHGTITGQDPPPSHCNNIGAVHRRQIHGALNRWFALDVDPEREFSRRQEVSELTCLTAEARETFRPQRVHQIVSQMINERLAAARQGREKLPLDQQRKQLRDHLVRLLNIPPTPPHTREHSQSITQKGQLTIRSIVLETDSRIFVPIVILRNAADKTAPPSNKVVLAVAEDGIDGLMRRRPDEIGSRLKAGWTVILADVRGTGMSRPAGGAGPQGALTRDSATSLMLGDPLLAGQLRDLVSVWRHVSPPKTSADFELTVLGDSAVSGLPADEPLVHPHRVAGRPAELQPAGPLLAILFACLQDEVTSVETVNGLSTFQSVLDSPFVQVPHGSIIPGILTEFDLPDLVATLPPRSVRLTGLIDGQGQAVSIAAAERAYTPAIRSYQASGGPQRLNFSLAP